CSAPGVYAPALHDALPICRLFEGMSDRTLEILESAGLLAHIGVALVFLVFVVHSKHLHIFLAPLNVMFKRRPDGLGAAQPMMSRSEEHTSELQSRENLVCR